MQSTHPVSALAPAFSPPQKQRFESGYPSPPSSGRTERHAKENITSVAAEDRRSKMDVMKGSATAVSVQCSHLHQARRSLTPPTTSEEQDSDDAVDEEEDGDDTITVMARTRSDTSWSDSLPISSPSTSVATHSHSQLEHHVRRTEFDYGSPYGDYELPLAPIRDTPRNPFLQGGPADVGYSGPSRHGKRNQGKCIPRERGRMTYVFRGQRVTYADPYASDSDEDGDIGPSRSSMMDRLQPKLLFPSAGKAVVQSTSSRDVFDAATKSDHKSTKSSKPTLVMAVERQTARFASGKSNISRTLLDKLDRAGWSDDNDEDDEEEAVRDEHEEEEDEEGEEEYDDEDGEWDDSFQEEQSYPQKCLIAARVEDSDDEEEMQVEEENPFMEPSMNQASVSFLYRLQQVQQNASSSSSRVQSGVKRSANNSHRYNPYSQQTRSQAYDVAQSVQVSQQF